MAEETVTRVVKLNIDTKTMRAYQREMFLQYSGTTRAIYNWAVAEWRKYKDAENAFVNNLIIDHIGTDNPEKMSEFRKDNKKIVAGFYKQFEPKEPTPFSLAAQLTEGMKDPNFQFYWNRSMPRNGAKRATRAVPGAVTNAALANYGSAVQSYYRTIKTKGFQLRKNGTPVGSPQFKSRGGDESFAFSGIPSFLKSHHVVTGRHRIQLPYVGSLRVHTDTKRLARYISNGGVPKSARFTYSGDRWYVAITVSMPVDSKLVQPRVNNSKKVFAGNLGVNKFLASADGSIIANQRLAEKEAENIKRIQRRLSELSYKKQEVQLEDGRIVKQYIDPLYPATMKKLRKAHHKLALHRQAFLHELSKQLTTRYGTIFLEDFNIDKMLKAPEPKPDPNKPGHFLRNGAKQHSKLAGGISDVAWGEFMRQLDYKSKLYGANFVKVDPAYNSLTCNECKNVNKNQPEIWEVFVCEKCGHTTDRDINAARNILELGFAQLG